MNDIRRRHIRRPRPARRRAPEPQAHPRRGARALRRARIDAQIDQIARKAGVGVGTVYRHFPNKEDLLQALIDARFEGLAEAAREAIATATPGRGSPASCATPPG